MTELETWKTGADNMARQYEHLKREADARIRELEARPCPHVVTNGTTSHCALAEAEVKRLEAQLAEADEALIAWNEKCARTLDENATLRAALEQVEWVDGWDKEGHPVTYCPWCNNVKGFGHKPDCVRQAALNPPPAQEWKPKDGWPAVNPLLNELGIAEPTEARQPESEESK